MEMQAFPLALCLRTKKEGDHPGILPFGLLLYYDLFCLSQKISNISTPPVFLLIQWSLISSARFHMGTAQQIHLYAFHQYQKHTMAT